ncbi:hypothetical protein D3C81_1314910 [compost metagenome]
MIMPRIRQAPSLPSKFQRTRAAASMAIRPRQAMDTRKKAVGTVPSSGAMMRMNRKLAPQTAARVSRRVRAMGLTVVSGYRAGRECTRWRTGGSCPFLRCKPVEAPQSCTGD